MRETLGHFYFEKTQCYDLPYSTSDWLVGFRLIHDS